MTDSKKYVEVLLPLKLAGTLTYCVPQEVEDDIRQGTWVRVILRAKQYTGIVLGVSNSAPSDIPAGKILPLEEVIDRAPVQASEIRFWKEVSEYYMCTAGEVFRAAYTVFLKDAPSAKRRRKKEGNRETPQNVQSELSEAQSEAYAAIKEAFSRGKRVLLHGVTGSGKTEIYTHLASEQLNKGKQVLYLVPEIAVSKQLQTRLEKCFGNRLLTFHSKMTSASRRSVIEALSGSGGPYIVLGTRSAVLLPFSNLGLIVVDEEHDQSYKQVDPAPRYNGRDAAMMLSAIHNSSMLLGSATPSYESLYNAADGKLVKVDLAQKFYNNVPPVVRIIDTNRERRLRNMRGDFSASLLKEMKNTLERGGQILVFRSRRAYAPFVQCTECGDVPKCPRCDVTLSYHKYNNSLSCHYCGYREPFTTRCKSCSEPALALRGAGTEKIEEELQELFPDKAIARFDSETTASKSREEKMIRDFAAHRIDILVGTQMITKGFDFERLELVVLMNADSLFAVQDFRSDERAAQLITQLLGRAGRRDTPGRIVIQTAQPEHPVLSGTLSEADKLKERALFRYPPYVRLLTITVKDKNEGRLWNACRMIDDAARRCGISEISGPVAPAISTIDGTSIREFWIKFDKAKSSKGIKAALLRELWNIEKELKGGSIIIPDVDPI